MELNRSTDQFNKKIAIVPKLYVTVLSLGSVFLIIFICIFCFHFSFSNFCVDVTCLFSCSFLYLNLVCYFSTFIYLVHVSILS